MPKKKYIVELEEEEQKELIEITSKGKIGARKLKRALILLKADEGLKDAEIMAALNVSRPTVERVRKRLVEGGLERALNDAPRPGKKRKMDDRQEAYLVALACSEAPRGHERWSLRLLSDKLVELDVIDSISHETVRRRLKKRFEAVAEEDVVYFQNRR
jgi:transposase